MQIHGEVIENMVVNMVLEKKLKYTQVQKDTIPCFFIWEWTFRAIQVMTMTYGI
jgi:hypothetical protein